jgi:hypothetical protein
LTIQLTGASGIDHPKTASGPESSFSLTRQAQTNRYDRRTVILYIL